MKAVIIYYSLEGDTELIAKQIAEETGAEMIALKPQKEISKEGFKKFFWGGKSVIFKEKPKLINKALELNNYDTIMIGTPIWAGSFAPPISTFLYENKFTNKRVILFACHSGGGAKKCFEKLTDELKGNTITDKADFVDPLKNNLPQIKNDVHEFCEQILKYKI